MFWAIVLHSFGVQVGSRASGLGLRGLGLRGLGLGAGGSRI